jgi:hypothetical protein
MKKILVQLDPDAHSSLFDAIVAIDSAIDELLQYSRVEVEAVRDIVHGAMFTRAPKHLCNTAIFIGGSDVQRGEALLKQVCATFFGPLRVSVMLDSNGANTTSAAAVLAAAKHLSLDQVTATILAGTGPVGGRVARLLAAAGARVRVGSRSLQKAQASLASIQAAVSTADGQLTAHETGTHEQLIEAISDAQLIVAAGAAGIELLPAAVQRHARQLQVAIDLNAVTPQGMESVHVSDQATDREGIICYGAMGVGGLKMSIHRAAVERLFTANDLVLDAEEIYALGRELQTQKSN